MSELITTVAERERSQMLPWCCDAGNARGIQESPIGHLHHSV